MRSVLLFILSLSGFTGCVSEEKKSDDQPKIIVTEQPQTHRMLVIGSKDIFLAPLSSDHPQKYSYILKAVLKHPHLDAKQTYQLDRSRTNTPFYTLATEPFVITDLSPPSKFIPARRTFKAALGRPTTSKQDAPFLKNLLIEIQDVIWIEKTGADKKNQDYIVFGNDDELYAARHNAKSNSEIHRIRITEGVQWDLWAKLAKKGASLSLPQSIPSVPQAEMEGLLNVKGKLIQVAIEVLGQEYPPVQ